MRKLLFGPIRKVKRITTLQEEAYVGMKLGAFLQFLAVGSALRDGSKPHIVFFLADDLGWNDVGYHGSNQIPTPNIDALAYTGVILDNYYVTPLCTPSRSAIMTGKYPIRTGLQHSVILGSTPYGLSLDEKILPQHFKRDGYRTKAVGKWHLGHFKKEYTPEMRGFDSHYGTWLGRHDYYDHSTLEKENWGYDIRKGLNVTWSDYGSYSTNLFTQEAVKTIKEHNASEPLFLYMAFQAVHSGNIYNPLQAPPETIAKFSYIRDERRRKFAGMLSKMDDSIGEVVEALLEKGMINDTIIIFSTDNGGPAAGFDDNAASNWPLRGVKSTLWEGGVRGCGFIWGSLLPSGVISKAAMHATDWLPTLLSAIRGKNALVDEVDGLSLWESLRDGKSSPRSEILINIDDKSNVSGLIYKSWKLIKGRARKGEWDEWYGPSGRGGSYNWDALFGSKTAESMERIKRMPSKQTIDILRQKMQVKCRSMNHVIQPSTPEETNVFLFDLTEDPCEMNNLAETEREQLNFMEKILRKYVEIMVEPRNKPSDPKSNPKFWGYKWINWMDYL